MIFNHTEADNLLADAIWWFKGFKARQSADAEDVTEGLAGSLRDTREWIKRLGHEGTRIIGLNEREVRIVITEGEFEQIRDFFMPTSGDEECKIAREAIEKINAQIRREQNARHKAHLLPF